MKTITKSSLSAVPAIDQRMPFAKAHILDNFVAPSLKAAETAPPKVIQNPRLEAWHSLFVQWKDDKIDSSISGVFEKILKRLKGLPGSASDIEQFSLQMGRYASSEYIGYYASLFLSALVKASPHPGPFYLHTSSIADSPGPLGYGNSDKHLVIQGGGGDYIGHMMSGGRITIEGEVGSIDGESLFGGTIAVNGQILKLNGPFHDGDVFQFDRQLVKDGKQIAEPENGI